MCEVHTHGQPFNVELNHGRRYVSAYCISSERKFNGWSNFNVRSPEIVNQLACIETKNSRSTLKHLLSKLKVSELKIEKKLGTYFQIFFTSESLSISCVNIVDGSGCEEIVSTPAIEVVTEASD